MVVVAEDVIDKTPLGNYQKPKSFLTVAKLSVRKSDRK